MILVNILDQKKQKSLYSDKLKRNVDPKLEAFWVALIKKVARIWKSISRKTSKWPGFIAQKTHNLWENLKEKIDYLFDKIHRNPKIF
jgi:hypothetical protein